MAPPRDPRDGTGHRAAVLAAAAAAAESARREVKLVRRAGPRCSLAVEAPAQQSNAAVQEEQVEKKKKRRKKKHLAQLPDEAVEANATSNITVNQPQVKPKKDKKEKKDKRRKVREQEAESSHRPPSQAVAKAAPVTGSGPVNVFLAQAPHGQDPCSSAGGSRWPAPAVSPFEPSPALAANNPPAVQAPKKTKSSSSSSSGSSSSSSSGSSSDSSSSPVAKKRRRKRTKVPVFPPDQWAIWTGHGPPPAALPPPGHGLWPPPPQALGHPPQHHLPSSLTPPGFPPAFGGGTPQFALPAPTPQQAEQPVRSEQQPQPKVQTPAPTPDPSVVVTVPEEPQSKPAELAVTPPAVGASMPPADRSASAVTAPEAQVAQLGAGELVDFADIELPPTPSCEATLSDEEMEEGQKTPVGTDASSAEDSGSDSMPAALKAVATAIAQQEPLPGGSLPGIAAPAVTPAPLPAVEEDPYQLAALAAEEDVAMAPMVDDGYGALDDTLYHHPLPPPEPLPLDDSVLDWPGKKVGWSSPVTLKLDPKLLRARPVAPGSVEEAEPVGIVVDADHGIDDEDTVVMGTVEMGEVQEPEDPTTVDDASAPQRETILLQVLSWSRTTRWAAPPAKLNLSELEDGAAWEASQLKSETAKKRAIARAAAGPTARNQVRHSPLEPSGEELIISRTDDFTPSIPVGPESGRQNVIRNVPWREPPRLILPQGSLWDSSKYKGSERALRARMRAGMPVLPAPEATGAMSLPSAAVSSSATSSVALGLGLVGAMAKAPPTVKSGGYAEKLKGLMSQLQTDSSSPENLVRSTWAILSEVEQLRFRSEFPQLMHYVAGSTPAPAAGSAPSSLWQQQGGIRPAVPKLGQRMVGVRPSLLPTPLEALSQERIQAPVMDATVQEITARLAARPKSKPTPVIAGHLGLG
mmetsp:Transcript_52213/g.124468  ORF Transcript_52213/g.124468 Transcript_52213/m.124468 type:complete len:919 (-) Transcript_52213:97-2853(-)